eukprot:SAG11_NODE_344_length_10440_cov_10.595494_9_plen_167_part_00
MASARPKQARLKQLRARDAQLHGSISSLLSSYSGSVTSDADASERAEESRREQTRADASGSDTATTTRQHAGVDVLGDNSMGNTFTKVVCEDGASKRALRRLQRENASLKEQQSWLQKEVRVAHRQLIHAQDIRSELAEAQQVRPLDRRARSSLFAFGLHIPSLHA